MTIQQTSTSRTVPTATISVPAYGKLIWLIPAAYALHIVEEYVGNFPGWVTDSVHGTFSYPGFIVNNLAFMIILVTIVTLNSRRATPARATALMVWASGNLLWDGLFHLLSIPVLDVYSPGLITSALLYFPISLIVATAVLTQRVLPPRRLALAALGGLAMFGFIVWYGLFHFAV